MSTYILEYKNSIPDLLCEEMIDNFENEKNIVAVQLVV